MFGVYPVIYKFIGGLSYETIVLCQIKPVMD